MNFAAMAPRRAWNVTCWIALLGMLMLAVSGCNSGPGTAAYGSVQRLVPADSDSYSVFSLNTESETATSMLGLTLDDTLDWITDFGLEFTDLGQVVSVERNGAKATLVMGLSSVDDVHAALEAQGAVKSDYRGVEKWENTLGRNYIGVINDNEDSVLISTDDEALFDAIADARQDGGTSIATEDSLFSGLHDRLDGGFIQIISHSCQLSDDFELATCDGVSTSLEVKDEQAFFVENVLHINASHDAEAEKVMFEERLKGNPVLDSVEVRRDGPFIISKFELKIEDLFEFEY